MAANSDLRIMTDGAALMAVREYLMTYFKGGCGQRLADTDNIVIDRDDPRWHSNRRYVQNLAKMADRQKLYIHVVPFLTMERAPSKVVFLRAHSDGVHGEGLTEQVKKFMGKYLAGVAYHNEGDLDNGVAAQRPVRGGVGFNNIPIEQVRAYQEAMRIDPVTYNGSNTWASPATNLTYYTDYFVDTPDDMPF